MLGWVLCWTEGNERNEYFHPCIVLVTALKSKRPLRAGVTPAAGQGLANRWSEMSCRRLLHRSENVIQPVGHRFHSFEMREAQSAVIIEIQSDEILVALEQQLNW